MTSRLHLLSFPLLLALLLLTSPALAQSDDDGDGVDDSTDACVAEDASFFDVDGDGCIDLTASARHIEYWDASDLPLTYVVHENGAPGIGDGSDFTALQNSFDNWSAVTGGRLSATFGGTVVDPAADGLDGVNQITFEDPNFTAIYGSSVLAVGITTSFETPTDFLGAPKRPGQIVDADMLFNPIRVFSTTGVGNDLESVGTHEAGHLFGINHSSVETATMFPALPPVLNARTLEPDDVFIANTINPDPASLATATQLRGTVLGGDDGLPVIGAGVFAIEVASGDTLGCQYTWLDGSYNFVGLPAVDVTLALHPLDGSAGISGMLPGYVNPVIEDNAETLFLPESWDSAESATDVATDATPISLVAGDVVTADFVTNVDVDAPAFDDSTPTDSDVDVPVESVLLVKFDEPVDFDSAVASVQLRAMDQAGQPAVAGALVQLSDETTLIFDPAQAMAYGEQYELSYGTGLEDRFGNSLSAPVVVSFTTEAEPALAITSVSPTQGTEGSVVSLSGVGIDPTATVDVGGTPATLISVNSGQIRLEVPAGLSGDVTITVNSGGDVATAPLFTVVEASTVVPNGEVFSSALLSGSPEDVVLTPDGDHAFVATTDGVSVVPLDPADPAFSTETTAISLSGGTDALAVTPDGRRVYAISRLAGKLYAIDSDDEGSLFGSVLDDVDLGATPRGITVDPLGRRAYIPTTSGSVLVYDVNRFVIEGLGPDESITYHREVGVIAAQSDLTGVVSVVPDGSELVVANASGDLVAFQADAPYAQTRSLSLGVDARDLVVDAVGQRAYVADFAGGVVPVLLDDLSSLPDIPLGTESQGLALGIDGSALYAANPFSDEVDIIDLVESSASFRSKVDGIGTSDDPDHLAVGPDGTYLVATQPGSSSLVISGLGFGSRVTAVSPPIVSPGDRVLVLGSGFPVVPIGTTSPTTVSVYFNDTEVPAIRSEPGYVEAVVPADFTGGTLRTRIRGGGAVIGQPNEPFSNSVSLPILEPNRDGVGLTVAAVLDSTLGHDWGQGGTYNSVTASPKGDLVAYNDLDTQEIVWIDALEGSPTYLRELQRSSYLPFGPTQIVLFTPDGNRAVYVSNGTGISIYDTDRSSPSFGQEIADANWSNVFPQPDVAPDIVDAVMLPDGQTVALSDPLNGTIWYLQLRESEIQYEIFAQTNTGFVAGVGGMATHPSGRYLYVISQEFSGGFVNIIDTTIGSSNYLDVIGFTGVQNTPRDIEVSPDGLILYVLGQDLGGASDRVLFQLDSFSPFDLVPGRSDIIDSDVTAGPQRLFLAPQGDRCVVGTVADQVYVRLNGLDQAAFIESAPNFNTNAFSPLGLDYSPNGRRLFSASENGSEALVLGVVPADNLTVLQGDGQTGVVNETLPVPIQIRLREKSGVARYGLMQVTALNGGRLPNGLDTQVFVSDANGLISFDWTLGDSPEIVDGQPLSRLQARLGIQGPANLVDAITLADPSTAVFEQVNEVPADLAADVDANTSAQLSFSRAVDPATISSSSLILRAVGASTPVPVAYGFTDGNRKVSLTPLVTLEPSTTYEMVTTAAIETPGSDPLTNPTTTTFTTEAAPPLSISSVSPPSGAVGAAVTLSGESFATPPSANTVFFNGVAVTPVVGGSNFLQVAVPLNATSGVVSVFDGTDSSNNLGFTVLEPSTTPLDEIVQTIDTGITTQGIAVTPDGQKAYSLSATTNQVIPLDLTTFATLPSIAVGNSPVAIAIDPAGAYAYVANFVSGTLSVIEVATDSVVETIPVGPNPFDVVVSPDGNDVYVLNTGDQTISVVDSDPESSTFHSVRASFASGESTKGAAISPDGSVLYVGSADGFLIISLDPTDYGVRASFATGESTKGATITPDGSLLILLTNGGNVIVVDVSTPGAESVRASFASGESTKGAAISPDGTLLYLLQEGTDEIVVVSIEQSGAVSVVEQESGAILPGTVRLEIVKTFVVGDDPSYIVFDPSGSRLALVGNQGDGTITVLNTGSTPYSPGLEATVDIRPRELTKPHRGRYICARINLPAPYSVRDIDIDSVRMAGVIPVIPKRWWIVDEDKDGVEELLVYFDRVLFEEVVPIGPNVPVCVSGVVGLDATPWEGCQEIKTIRPTLLFPTGGENWRPGEIMSIRWTSPPGFEGPDPGDGYLVSINVSYDDGETWTTIVKRIPDTGGYDWLIPGDNLSRDVRISVVLLNALPEDIGMTLVPEKLWIGDDPIAVSFSDFRAEPVEGDARLRWSAGAGSEAGFHVSRARGEGSSFERITTAPLEPTGFSRDHFEFELLDTDVIGNVDYRYLVEEVRGGETVASHGPFSLRIEVRDSLEQNFPNSFNPRTSIRFSVAEEGRGRLAVFDLRGRLVKVLLDEHLRPDVYRVEWDGTDGRGGEVASGVYFYRLTTENGVKRTRKMTLVR